MLRSGIRLKLWKMKPIFSLRRRERASSESRLTSLAVELVAAGVEGLEQAGDVEERGLAGAGRAGDGDELPGLHLEREVAQRVRLDEVGAVDLADVVHLEHVGLLASSGTHLGYRDGDFGRVVEVARVGDHDLVAGGRVRAAPRSRRPRRRRAPPACACACVAAHHVDEACVASSMNEPRSNFSTSSRSSSTMRTEARSFWRRPAGWPPRT